MLRTASQTKLPATDFFQKLTGTQMVQQLSHFKEPDGSLPAHYIPTNAECHELDISIPRFHTLSFPDTLQYRPNDFTCFLQVTSTFLVLKLIN
jgi:hypothetical protein